MKTIFILADTTCRRYLNSYNPSADTITPNLNRLAEKSTVFENHWCGSAPCMPARRDIFTGRLNFLERNWGGAEPFDYILPKALRQSANVYSHIITDHTFYVEKGGENFHTGFDSWVVHRGQEHDVLVAKINKEPVPKHLGLLSSEYNTNRTAFVKEEDYPTPKTFQSAVDWLKLNHDADNYFLWVESFDPHEPFDTPKSYRELYNDNYEGTEYFWPHYAPCEDSEEENHHIRNCYKATLTMMDKWLGKLLDTMDEQNLWEDTALIFTTDHGFMLGEHGFMAKNYMPAYNEVFHIPLFVYHPKIDGGKKINALTQNIDMYPTILDFFNIDKSILKNEIHGKSLMPLLENKTDKLRDYVIYGYYGLSVNITDGKYTYFCAAKNEDNSPLNMYTAIPVTLRQNFGYDSIDDFKSIETGRFLKWTDYPVLKIPSEKIDYKNDSQRFTKRSKYNKECLLFDISSDYAQNFPIKDEKLESKMRKALKETMIAHDTPEEQIIRLGL